jgi:diguanylate cyclase (GGDEF)-like protein/PAS domain S-box-containing protein
LVEVHVVAEQEVEQLRFQASVLEAVGQPVIATDLEGKVLYWNRAAEEIYGWSSEEALGRSLRDLTVPEESLEKAEEVVSELRAGRTWSGEVLLRRKDGSYVPVFVTATPVFDERGNLEGMIGVSADMSERKALEAELERRAFQDTLTGLPNRALFLDRLQHALARIERDGGQLAVLFLDLDDFKIINDSLGHEAGDRLLVCVAERLSSRCRAEDTVARLAGDEFGFVLEDSVRDEAVHFAERIAQVLRDPFVLEGREVFVSPSIGIALGGATTNTDAQELLGRADLAMYRAKRSGKARHAVFEEEMNVEALRRLERRSQLEQALEREEFVVYYQPQVELATGKPLLMEALVRWKHPRRGLLQPGSFLPVAEQTGLVVPMGQLVLREACHQAKVWQELYPSESPVGVSVNLSSRELERPDLVEDVARTLRDTGLDPSDLTFEISERVDVDKTPAVLSVLKEVKSLGVCLAIDDFGTGFSSIAYVENFPADYLKIDIALVSRLTQNVQNVRSWKFVIGIITLARFLGYKTIAEGVETVEQLEGLRRCKSDLAQGFYFCEPLPGEEASAMIAEHLP